MYLQNRNIHSYILLISVLFVGLLYIIMPPTISRNQNGTSQISIVDMIKDIHIEPERRCETVKIEQSEIYIQSIPTSTPIDTKVIEAEQDDVYEAHIFSKKDIDIVARVTMSEASIESYNVQVAVAQTVFNRFYSGKFGDTISDVVYTKHQFSTADNGTPTEQVYQAVYEAMYNPPHPTNMLYFRQWYFHKFAEDYKQIGCMYFSLGDD